MKKKDNQQKMGKSLFFVLISFLLLNPLAAQTYPESSTDLPPAPQTWSFMRYGNSRPNLYTGTVSVDIPIYSYQDPDFSLDVSASYASNGLLPHMQAGPLGLGWFLNAGGTITREINETPDEKEELLSGFWYLHNKTDVLSTPTVDKFWIHPQGKNMYIFDGDPKYYETKPDIFHFNFMGYQGSFCLGYNKRIHVFNSNVPPGEIKIDITDLRKQEITIRTGNGYVYEFEGEKGNDVNIYVNTTWVLTKITAPNQRYVKFTYDRPQNVVQQWVPRAERYSFYETTTFHKSQWAYEEASSGRWGNAVSNFNKSSSRNTAHLLEINVNEKLLINFSYSDKKQEFELALSLKKLDSIVVTAVGTDNPAPLKTCYFSYYPTNASGAKKLLLHQVSISGEGDYSMDYHNRAADFPDLNTYEIDHWGYYNGNTFLDQSTYLPKVKIDSLRYDESIVGTDYRAPDADHSKLGILTEIRYPTGGKSIFEYEGHDYEFIVKRISEHFFKPQLCWNEEDDDPKPTGGVRIKKIHDYDSENTCTTREFIYKKEYDQSSGTLLHLPRYSLAYASYVSRDVSGAPLNTYRWVSGVSTDLPILTASDKSHIGYSQVTEKLSDSSKVVYKFSDYYEIRDRIAPPVNQNPQPNYIVNPSPMNSLVDGNVIIPNLMSEPISYHTQRGKLIEKSTYNSDSQLVYKESYIYDRNKTLETLSVHRQHIWTIFGYKILVDDYPLEKVVKTEYQDQVPIISETIKYTYNSIGQKTTEETTDSRGWIHRTKTQSIYDLNPTSGAEKEMLDSNRINEPVRIFSTIQEPLSATELLTGGIKYSYEGKAGFPAIRILKPLKIEKAELLEPKEITGYNFDAYLGRVPEIRFDYYDKKGNILQTTDRNKIKTAYIWGYGGLYLVAKVENASYDMVRAISGLTDILNGPLTEALTDAQYKALSELSGAMVTAYTYKPFVGVSSIKDPSGRTTYYEYDANGRLIAVKDDQRNLIESYDYHYKQ